MGKQREKVSAIIKPAYNFLREISWPCFLLKYQLPILIPTKYANKILPYDIGLDPKRKICFLSQTTSNINVPAPFNRKKIIWFTINYKIELPLNINNFAIKHIRFFMASKKSRLL